MTVHLIKLCVGAESISDLMHWQKERLAAMRRGRKQARLFHATRMVPKRREEVLDGGSLYWVIKGVVQVRQRIVGLEDGRKKDGTPCCLIVLDRRLVPVRPVPRRAFQGWRYLPPEEAPPDLQTGSADGLAALPPRLRTELAELGLI
jgi:hypothetical protein